MSKNLIPPKEIVSKVLNISVDQLNDDSAYGETPNWDSLNHIDIINKQIYIPFNISESSEAFDIC